MDFSKQNRLLMFSLNLHKTKLTSEVYCDVTLIAYKHASLHILVINFMGENG